MPGLLRGVARTAVIAGTASAVNGRVQRRQAERFAGRDAQIYAERQAAYQQQAPVQQPQTYAQPAAQPAAPAGGGEADTISQLKELAALRDQGVLTDAEFEAQKAKVLG